MPFTPIATINSAATISVARVRPEIGLFELPIIPTKFPDTAAKKNPRIIITTAATTAAVIEPAKCAYRKIIATNVRPSPTKTVLKLRSRS